MSSKLYVIQLIAYVRDCLYSLARFSHISCAYDQNNSALLLHMRPIAWLFFACGCLIAVGIGGKYERVLLKS